MGIAILTGIQCRQKCLFCYTWLIQSRLIELGARGHAVLVTHKLKREWYSPCTACFHSGRTESFREVKPKMLRVLLLGWGQGSSEYFEQSFRDLHLRKGGRGLLSTLLRLLLSASFQRGTLSKCSKYLNPTSQKLIFELFWQLFIPVILSQTRTSMSIAVICSCRLFIWNTSQSQLYHACVNSMNKPLDVQGKFSKKFCNWNNFQWRTRIFQVQAPIVCYL